MVPMRCKDFEYWLSQNNFILLRTSGSHKVYKRGNDSLAVPHSREISVGIVRQAVRIVKNQLNSVKAYRL